MLRKLIKYEFKATGKFMLLMYGLLIVMSGMISAGLIFNFEDIIEDVWEQFYLGGAIMYIFVFFFGVLFVVISVVSIAGIFFYAISRFKNNLLGDEGYLMHTLPVKTRDHVLSKCIVSTIWTLAGFFVAVLAYYIIFAGVMGIEIFKAFCEAAATIFFENKHTIMLSAEILLLIILEIISIYFKIYASMAMGFSANTHRFAKSIGFFILLGVAKGIFELCVFKPSMLLEIGTVSSENNTLALFYEVVVKTAEAVVYCLITCHFLSKKLNLQ